MGYKDANESLTRQLQSNLPHPGRMGLGISAKQKYLNLEWLKPEVTHLIKLLEMHISHNTVSLSVPKISAHHPIHIDFLLFQVLLTVDLAIPKQSATASLQ